jgi:hypothetical protein
VLQAVRQRSFKHQSSRLVFAAALLLGASIAGGCASTANVAVESDFPTPLVEPLRLRVGVHYPEDLRKYEYSEEIPQHSTWRFDLGEANVKMFSKVFGAMFSEVAQVNPSVDSSAAAVDLILTPRLERFEFDIPRHEDVKFVEVWMQYRLFVYAGDGTPIAEWPITGYGKSKAAGSMPRASLHDATIRAMREAGATISIRFASHPDIRDWLQEKHNASTIIHAGTGY